MFDKTKIRYSSWAQHPVTILFLFTIFILLIRIFLRGQILEVDEAEQVILAQKLQVGYPDQPPLYAWLQYVFFKLFGFKLFSLALLKSFLLFGCLYSFHQICRLHCQSISLAWCATLSWALIPAISLDLIKDNTHSILALLSACLSWYWFVAPSKLSKTTWYLVLGCIMGMGLLSKYNYLLFFAILLASLVSIPAYRKKVLNPGMLLALLVSFLIASPYISWLQHHLSIGLGSTYKLAPPHKQPWQGLTELMKAILLFALPPLLIPRFFFPLERKLAQQKAHNSLVLRYHLMAIPLLIAIILAARLRNFETRWLIPLLFLLPVLFFSQVKHETKRRINLFLSLCLLVQAAMFTALIYRSHSNHNLRSHYPFQQVIQLIKNEHQPMDYIVTDSHWFLGNLMLGFPFDKGLLLYPPAQLPKGKSLLIWQGAIEPSWIAYLARSQALGEIKLIRDPKNQGVIAGYLYASRT